jgi:sugar/nucleoside kinase (ribokinase family)
MGKNVVVLGGLEGWLTLYVDSFPSAIPQTVFCNGFHETIGGTGFGKSMNLSRLGFDVCFHSPLGEDDLGNAARSALSGHVRFLFDIDAAGTRRQIHIINADGERVSYFLNHGSLNPAVNSEKLESLIAASDIVIINTINYTKALIPLIKGCGKEIWCDIHDYCYSKTYFNEYVNCADYLHMSSCCMPEYREFMEQQISNGKKLVVCTHAQRGASALTSDGKWIDVPIIERYVRIDPNGAGDGFFSGVLFGLESGFPIEIAMRFGAIVGGLSVTTPEASHPDLSEQLLLREYQESYVSA